MDAYFQHVTRPEWGAAIYHRRVDHNRLFFFSGHRSDWRDGAVAISPRHLHLIRAIEAPADPVQDELRRLGRLHAHVGPSWTPPGVAQATLNRPLGLVLIQPDPSAPFVEAMRQIHQRHYGQAYVRPQTLPYRSQSLLHLYGYSVHQGGLPPGRRLALLVEFLYTELPRCWPDAQRWHRPATVARLMEMERHILWLASFVGAAEHREQAQQAWMADFDALVQEVRGSAAPRRQLSPTVAPRPHHRAGADGRGPSPVL